MVSNTKTLMTKMFEKWSGEPTFSFDPLPQSGSYREYFRLKSKEKSALGVLNPDRKENIAFISFSKHFRKKGFDVPEIYDENLDASIYLIQDLGDTTLYSFLSQVYKNGIFPKNLIDIYKQVVTILPRFQVLAGRDLDYSVCYPRSRFDKRSMMWDLNYFKYYFLKLARVSFDEQELEDDFQKFSDFLLTANCNYFLYRDFQSRNIMLFDGKPYFIDYQGGRKGALQYDLASLLYDAKADIPQHIREGLLYEYMKNLRMIIDFDEKEFLGFFWGYVLIRIMQAMGSYGFRGFYEKKEHFLKSIPYATANLDWILSHIQLPVNLPMLTGVLKSLVDSPKLKAIGGGQNHLKVIVNSFAYKRGIPSDYSGNGGGFVFDCRGILNPGRYEKYKNLTGNDAPVIDFFKTETNIDEFLQNVYRVVDPSVENYISRKFTDLMVNFGCTGGQHRSVYCANAFANHLKSKFHTEVVLRHLALENE